MSCPRGIKAVVPLSQGVFLFLRLTRVLKYPTSQLGHCELSWGLYWAPLKFLKLTHWVLVISCCKRYCLVGLAHWNTLTGHHTSEWLVYFCLCTESRGHNTVSKVGQDPLPLGEVGRACPIEKWYSVNNRSCHFSGIWPDLIPEPIPES